MAKVVICPSCQSKGSIPDEVKASRIRCPKCGQMFDVKAASASGGPNSATLKKPGSSTGARPAAASKAKASAYDDVEGAEPLPSMAKSGTRRSVAAAPAARGQAASGQGSGQSPMLYAVLGVGSLAVVLLIGLLVAVSLAGPLTMPRSRRSWPRNRSLSR